MPELSDADLRRAVRGNGAAFLRSPDAPEEQATPRPDSDGLAGFRETGAGWRERVDAALAAPAAGLHVD